MQVEEELYKLYEDFCANILALIVENEKTSKGYSVKLKKVSKQKESIAINYAVESKETHFYLNEDQSHQYESLEANQNELVRGMSLSCNADFIYLMALYESFLNSLIKILINKDKKIRKEYMNYFSNFAIEQHEKYKNKSLLLRLTEPKKCIDSLDDLKPLMSVVNFLIKHPTDDPIYKGCYAAYLEARERRNLFVHRGTILDSKYENTLKQLLRANNLNKKFQEIIGHVKSNAFNLPMEWHGGKKDCAHSLDDDDFKCISCSAKYVSPPGHDLTVIPSYLYAIYGNVFFLSSIIFRQAIANISKATSSEDEIDIFRGTLHNHMVKIGLEMNDGKGRGYRTPAAIYTYCKSYISDKPDAIARINNLLCLIELVELKLIHFPKDSDSRTHDKKTFNKFIEFELMEIPNTEIQSLFRAYLNKDYKNYIKLGLNFVNNKDDLEKWFMTQKLLKQKKFSQIFKNT